MQQQIAKAFILLLRNRPYAAISVSEICKQAGVSRQTFYSLFSSRENIVIYLLDKSHEFLPGQSCAGKELTLKELSREYSRYITDRREFLQMLVRNDIVHLLHECLYQSFIACPSFLPGQSDVRRKFGAEYIAGALSGIARIYAETPESSREELEQTITDLFSGRLFR